VLRFPLQQGQTGRIRRDGRFHLRASARDRHTENSRSP
jgi:hypothetical protein